MSICKFDYYKLKFRKVNLSLRKIIRQCDLEIIKQVYNKHMDHGYRCINIYGVYYIDIFIYILCL